MNNTRLSFGNDHMKLEFLSYSLIDLSIESSRSTDHKGDMLLHGYIAAVLFFCSFIWKNMLTIPTIPHIVDYRNDTLPRII
jgi:hypothetical protein